MLKYRAFISYSHSDSKIAKWLHSKIESYKVPKDLIGKKSEASTIPSKLRPIFRDRDEISGGADHDKTILSALDASSSLIVVCSPAAASSPAVHKEIKWFKSRHPERSVIPVIIAGKYPNFLPQPLRYQVLPSGEITSLEEKTIGADLRVDKDGKQLALSKVIAGILGVQTDEIVKRDQKRFRKQIAFFFSILMITTGAFGALAFWGEVNRQDAVSERNKVQAALHEIQKAQAKIVSTSLDPRVSAQPTNLSRLLPVLPEQNGKEYLEKPDQDGLPITNEAYGALLRITNINNTATRILPLSKFGISMLEDEAVVVPSNEKLTIFKKSMARHSLFFEGEQFLCANFDLQLFITATKDQISVYELTHELTIQEKVRFDNRDFDRCIIGPTGAIAFSTKNHEVFVGQPSLKTPLTLIPNNAEDPTVANLDSASVLIDFSPSGSKLYITRRYQDINVIGYEFDAPAQISVVDIESLSVILHRLHDAKSLSVYGYDENYLIRVPTDTTGRLELWSLDSGLITPKRASFAADLGQYSPSRIQPMTVVSTNSELHFYNNSDLEKDPFWSFKLADNYLNLHGWSTSGRFVVVGDDDNNRLILVDPLSQTYQSLVYDQPLENFNSGISLIERADSENVILNVHGHFAIEYSTSIPTEYSHETQLTPYDEGLSSHARINPDASTLPILSEFLLSVDEIDSANHSLIKTLCEEQIAEDGVETYITPDGRFFHAFLLYQFDVDSERIVYSVDECKNPRVIDFTEDKGFIESSITSVAAIAVNNATNRVIILAQELVDEEWNGWIHWFDSKENTVTKSKHIGQQSFSVPRIITEPNFQIVAVFENPYNSDKHVRSQQVSIWDDELLLYKKLNTESDATVSDVFVDGSFGQVIVVDTNGVMHWWSRDTVFQQKQELDGFGSANSILGRSQEGWLLVKSYVANNTCALIAVKPNRSAHLTIDQFKCGWYAGERYENTFISENKLIFPGGIRSLDLTVLDANPYDVIAAWRMRFFNSELLETFEGYSGRADQKRVDMAEIENVTECDRLTADPFDPNRLMQKGVESDSIFARLALEACTVAVKENETPRLSFQIGRSFEAYAQVQFADPELFKKYINNAYLWYEAAWKKAYPAAANQLANIVTNFGTELDTRLDPIQLYKEALSLGIYNAAVSLGDHYWSGKIVAQDRAKAREYWRVASNAGDPVGHLRIAELHTEEHDQSFDLKKALFHFALAEKRFTELGVVAKAEIAGSMRASIARTLQRDIVSETWSRVREYSYN